MITYSISGIDMVENLMIFLVVISSLVIFYTVSSHILYIIFRLIWNKDKKEM
jgi:type IV secretory pathway VirB3-like protein